MLQRFSPRRADALGLGLVVLLAGLTYVVQDRPVRALVYLGLGAAFIMLTVLLRGQASAGTPTRAQRVRKGAIQLIVFGEALALAVGLVQPRDIWRLLLGVELVVLAVALTALPAMLRRVRAQRAAGASYDGALLTAAAEVLPPTVLAVARAELAVLRAAFRLVTPVRRSERDAIRLSYGSSERLMFWVLMASGLIELAVLDYFLRNTALRVPIAVLGILTLPYVLGLVALTKAYPHLLYGDRLTLRSGPTFQVDVPLQLLSGGSRRTTINQRNGAHRDEDGTLRVVRGGQTDLRLELSAPLATSLGSISRIEAAVDDVRHPAVDRLLRGWP